MKNKIIALILCVLLLVFAGCKNIGRNLPKYDRKECYYGEGFQDYTDYCKYYYNDTTIEKFKTNESFCIVAEKDISSLKSYFVDFENRIKGTTISNYYDFNYSSQVKVGDYFSIKVKDNCEDYSNYDVYYVDMANEVMYYIHSNT